VAAIKNRNTQTIDWKICPALFTAPIQPTGIGTEKTALPIMLDTPEPAIYWSCNFWKPCPPCRLLETANILIQLYFTINTIW